jgi:hypothetical protein
MAHKRRIVTDDEFKLVIKNTPEGESPAVYAAKILRIHRTTADKYMQRIFKPAAFFGNNHYIRQHVSRKRPVTPSVAQIVLALKMTDGDCAKAARILDCSPTPVRHYIMSERAAGRSCGRYRVKGVQIAKPIPSNAKCHPLTDADKAVMAAVIAHMGEELAGVTF